MSENDSFSFRWGIPLLDDGDTRVPNWMFDHYIEAGATRSEFLAILHLARYQYEKAGSECRPSVSTVAQQMGYSRRGLQKVLAGIEAKEFLIKNLQPGKPTIYDFGGFSRAVLAIYLACEGANPSSQVDANPSSQAGANSSSQAGANPSSQVDANPSSHKEKHIRRTNKNSSSSDLLTRNEDLLLSFGVTLHKQARALAALYTPGQIAHGIERAKAAVKSEDDNPQGLLVHWMAEGNMPDPPKPKTKIGGLISGREREPKPEEVDPDLARAQGIWQTALAELALQMTRSTFNTWLKPTRVVAYEDGVFVVRVENTYAQEWLEHRLRPTIVRTLAGVVGGEAEVRFEVVGGEEG